jgi:hypothetical protein
MEDKATEELFFICNKDFMEIHSAIFVVLRVQILQSHSANFVKQAYANCTLIDKGINNKKRKIRKDVFFLFLPNNNLSSCLSSATNFNHELILTT